jgi:hypothetical protein
MISSGTQDNYTFEEKLSNLSKWIYLPLEELPQLILGVFLHLFLLADEYTCKHLLL